MLDTATIDAVRHQLERAPRRKFEAGLVAELLGALVEARHDLALERARSREKGRLLAEAELRRRPLGW